jgi:signal transduction histidine kinase
MLDQFHIAEHKASDELSSSALPSHHQWCAFESNRLLLEPRKLVVSGIFRIIAAATLVLYVPLGWVAAWVILVFGSNFWMRSFIRGYTRLLSVHPNTQVMTPAMEKIVQGYKHAWMINCLIWGSLSFLSQFWLPDAPRLVCLVILNALMYQSITRTHVDRRLMHRVSALLLITQFVFVSMRYVFLKSASFAYPDDTDRFLAYVFYFFLMSYLLWVVGNRFNQMHVQRLNSEYAKLQLIETLNKNKEQLDLEQQALTASNKLVQQFYSGAAHDLRQPVYAMQLYTAMLSEDPSQNKFLLPKITQSCIAINDMFNTLFDYQQTHLHDTELVEKDIQIQDTFKSLALHFQPIATGKGLQIRFRPITGTVTMVPLYLTRILSNLIANALRYTNTGGVLVAARKTRAGIRFEIWDTGIGIADSKLKHIFNEFYKINKVDVVNDGLGLGLAIAKQLSMRVEQTDIAVRSRPERGSVFTFAVPLERYKAA